MNEAEIWMMTDEAGDYVVAKDQDDLNEVWENEIGDLPTSARIDCIRVRVELPSVKTLTVDLPLGTAGAVLLPTA